ncbi:MAG: hypothetical protein V4793_26705 [Paraburkholderia tropica]
MLYFIGLNSFSNFSVTDYASVFFTGNAVPDAVETRWSRRCHERIAHKFERAGDALRPLAGQCHVVGFQRAGPARVRCGHREFERAPRRIGNRAREIVCALVRAVERERQLARVAPRAVQNDGQTGEAAVVRTGWNLLSRGHRGRSAWSVRCGCNP